jgi:transposase
MVKGQGVEYRRDEKRTYRRKPGGGRKPLDPRRVLESVFYVLRTGIQRKTLPKEYGAASISISANGRRSVADVAGIAYDLLAGIGWEWQSEVW